MKSRKNGPTRGAMPGGMGRRAFGASALLGSLWLLGGSARAEEQARPVRAGRTTVTVIDETETVDDVISRTQGPQKSAAGEPGKTERAAGQGAGAAGTGPAAKKSGEPGTVRPRGADGARKEGGPRPGKGEARLRERLRERVPARVRIRERLERRRQR
jgi:hypothetical protein